MKQRVVRTVKSGFLVPLRMIGHSVAQTDQGEGPLAARLLAARSADWHSIERPDLVIHVLKGSPADMEAQSVTDSVVAIRGDLLRQLDLHGLRDSGRPAHVFFLDSRETMQRLTERPLMGFVQAGEPTGVFVYTRGYHTGALLRHELTHLLTFQYWGTPRVDRWLVEGIAVWAGGLCQGYAPDELTAGGRARGRFASLTELGTRFRELPEDVAMPEAGSITGFLVRREGLRGIRERWTRTTDSGAHPLGPGGPALERAWLAHIDSARPAQLDIPRMLIRGC
jgi:hypothetical protein